MLWSWDVNHVMHGGGALSNATYSPYVDAATYDANA